MMVNANKMSFQRQKEKKSITDKIGGSKFKISQTTKLCRRSKNTNRRHYTELKKN